MQFIPFPLNYNIFKYVLEFYSFMGRILTVDTFMTDQTPKNMQSNVI